MARKQPWYATREMRQQLRGFVIAVLGASLPVGCSLDADGELAMNEVGGMSGSSGGLAGAGGGIPDSSSDGAGMGGVAGSMGGNPDAGTDATAGDAGVAGTAGAAGSDGGPTLPTDVAGLLLWLRADMGIVPNGPQVVTWTDQSGHGNDYTQPNSIYQPIVVAAAIAGRPVVRFTAEPKYLEGAGLTFSAGLTVFVVARLESIPGVNDFYELFDNGVAGSESRIGFNGSAKYEHLYFGVRGPLVHTLLPSPDTAPHLIELTWNGGPGADPSSYSSAIDGVSTTIALATTATPSPGSIIGAYAGSLGSHFQGDVGEIVVYDQVVGSADRDALRANFKTFWSIP